MDRAPKPTSFFPLPLPGLRILKTGIAVFLCFLIYLLRNQNGMVIQSVIAAIICVQPYTSGSRKGGRNRVIGTVTGCLFGLLYLLLASALPKLFSSMIFAYLIMSVGVILVLYTCVCTRLTDSAALSAIVFLCVIIAFPDVPTPVRLAFDRCIDTLIGVFVAIFVNSFHFPQKKHPEKLFFLRTQDLADDRYAKISPSVLIRLNRLYEDGIRICLESRWAPGFLIPQIRMLNVNMPVIVMEGAALYDISENRYYEVMNLPRRDADYLRDYLLSRGLSFLVFAIRNDSMLLFHYGDLSEAERLDYETARKSPYRNYLPGTYYHEDQVVMFRFLVPEGEADEWEIQLNNEEKLQRKFKISRRDQPGLPGTVGFYLLRHDVSIEAMEDRLINYLETERKEPSVPVHILPHREDYRPSKDVSLLLDKVKNSYEEPLLPFTDRSSVKEL